MFLIAAAEVIKNTFATAIIELMDQYSVDKVTILQLCQHSGLGRQTFYNHFRDKYDLVNWIYDAKTKDIFEEYKKGEDWSEVICKIFQHFLAYKQFYQRISKSQAQNSFSSFLIEHTRKYYIDAIIAFYGVETITDNLLYTIEFNTYGAVNMSLKWICGGMKETPLEMTALMMKNMPSDLSVFFHDA